MSSQKTFYTSLLIFAIFFGLLFSVPVLAEDFGLSMAARESGLDKISGDLPSLMGQLIGTALSMIGVIFFALMIYGGFLWMTARGNSEDEGKALNTIFGAVIGIIIIMSAYALTSFVFKSVVGGLGSAGGGGTPNPTITPDQRNVECITVDAGWTCNEIANCDGVAATTIDNTTCSATATDKTSGCAKNKCNVGTDAASKTVVCCKAKAGSSGQTGTLGNGESCTGNEQCQSGFCSDTDRCLDAPADNSVDEGASCSNHTQCKTGLCVFYETKERCMVFPADCTTPGSKESFKSCLTGVNTYDTCISSCKAASCTTEGSTAGCRSGEACLLKESGKPDLECSAPRENLAFCVVGKDPIYCQSNSKCNVSSSQCNYKDINDSCSFGTTGDAECNMISGGGYCDKNDKCQQKSAVSSSCDLTYVNKDCQTNLACRYINTGSTGWKCDIRLSSGYQCDISGGAAQNNYECLSNNCNPNKLVTKNKDGSDVTNPSTKGACE